MPTDQIQPAGNARNAASTPPPKVRDAQAVARQDLEKAVHAVPRMAQTWVSDIPRRDEEEGRLLAEHADTTLLDAIAAEYADAKASADASYERILLASFSLPSTVSDEGQAKLVRNHEVMYRNYADSWNAKSNELRQAWKTEADQWRAAFRDDPGMSRHVNAAFDKPPPIDLVRPHPSASLAVQDLVDKATTGGDLPRAWDAARSMHETRTSDTQASRRSEAELRSIASQTHLSLLEAIAAEHADMKAQAFAEYESIVIDSFYPGSPFSSSGESSAKRATNFSAAYKAYETRWQGKSHELRQAWQSVADQWKLTLGSLKDPAVNSAVEAVFDTPPPTDGLAHAAPSQLAFPDGLRSAIGIADRDFERARTAAWDTPFLSGDVARIENNRKKFGEHAMHANDTLKAAITAQYLEDKAAADREYDAILEATFPAKTTSKEEYATKAQQYKTAYMAYAVKWGERSYALQQSWQSVADKFRNGARSDIPSMKNEADSAFKTPPPMSSLVKRVHDPSSGDLDAMVPEITSSSLSTFPGKPVEKELTDRMFEACLAASEDTPERKWADLVLLKQATIDGTELGGTRFDAGRFLSKVDVVKLDAELAKVQGSSELKFALAARQREAMDILVATRNIQVHGSTLDGDPFITPGLSGLSPELDTSYLPYPKGGPDRATLVSQWKAYRESEPYQNRLLLMTPEQVQKENQDLMRELALLDPDAARIEQPKLDVSVLNARIASSLPNTVDDDAGQLAAALAWRTGLTAGKIALEVPERVSSTIGLWQVFKKVSENQQLGDSAAWLKAAEELGDPDARQGVRGFIDSVKATGMLGTVAGILGISSAILKWVPEGEKKRLLRVGDPSAALELVKDISKLTDLTNYSRMLTTLGWKSTGLGLHLELGVLASDHVASLRPLTRKVSNALNNVNLLDQRAVKAALREIDTQWLKGTRFDADALATKIQSKAGEQRAALGAADVSTETTLTFGGNAESSSELATFVTGNFAELNEKGLNLLAQADQLHNVPLNNVQQVSQRLQTTGMSAERANSLAGAIRETAEEMSAALPQHWRVNGGTITDIEQITNSQADLVDLLYRARARPAAVEASVAARNAAEALDGMPALQQQATSLLDDAVNGGRVVATTTLGKNIGLFLKGMAEVVGVAGNVIGIVLDAKAIADNPHADAKEIAGHALGIGAGGLGLAATALSFSPWAAAAGPVGFIALAAGLTALFLTGNETPSAEDYFDAFLDRVKPHGVLAEARSGA